MRRGLVCAADSFVQIGHVPEGDRRVVVIGSGHPAHDLVEPVRHLRDQDDVGTAGDVVGDAEGVVAGNALRWRYVMALPVDGKTINVDFDDWMYQMDDDVMLNRARMSKFGVTLGEVTLSFRKRR